MDLDLKSKHRKDNIWTSPHLFVSEIKNYNIGSS